MLLPQLRERWYRDVKCVIAVMLLDSINFILCCEALGFLKHSDGWSWLLIYFVGQRRKAVFFRFVEEPALLEEERYVLLSANLFRVSLFHVVLCLHY